jgi:SAM-dependent methyltransferase
MSRDYWEHRYQTNDTSWEKGAPAPGLLDFLESHPRIPRGTVAVPGCGTGHDVRAFARFGFAAHGFDFAPSAIRLAREKTRAAGLAAQFHPLDFLHADPPQKFDWLFEHTLFCAIKPQERDDYTRAVLKWLKPGGLADGSRGTNAAFFTTFNLVGRLDAALVSQPVRQGMDVLVASGGSGALSRVPGTEPMVAIA